MAEEEIISQLETYQSDPTMITESVYSPAACDYPENKMPFAEVHLAYLRKHKNVNPKQYLSNLRIMIKKR